MSAHQRVVSLKAYNRKPNTARRPRVTLVGLKKLPVEELVRIAALISEVAS